MGISAQAFRVRIGIFDNAHFIQPFRRARSSVTKYKMKKPTNLVMSKKMFITSFVILLVLKTFYISKYVNYTVMYFMESPRDSALNDADPTYLWN